MSDIFISYASKDRPVAQQLSEAFARYGWSVWWDREILPGKAFDQAISDALDAARCVVVLWSQASINSDWVKEEASEGLARGVFVPVLIEDIRIPLGFRRIQAARLIDWKGDDHHPGFRQLTASIQQILGGKDIASCLVDYLADEFEKEQGMDLRRDPFALQRLQEAADKAKIELSSVQQVEVNLPFITADVTGPKHLRVKVMRAKLESLRRASPCND